MITEQEYQEAIERAQACFKRQGMTQSEWQEYKSALAIQVRYKQQQKEQSNVKSD